MRQPSESVAIRNQSVLESLRELKADHPFWGYRHCWAHLRYVNRLDVNKKRVYRLMKQHRLLATQTTYEVPRLSLRPKPRADRPNQWWGIDMTKAMTDSGWAYIVLVKDWFTKQIVGHHCGTTATSREWLLALERGLQRQCPDGSRTEQIHLMSDNGSQPTSLTFMRLCGTLGVKQAFTSYNNPKGNADTERIMRTLKEELVWLREWRDPHQLSDELSKWIENYNQTWLHQALNYRTPNQVADTYNQSHQTLLAKAC